MRGTRTAVRLSLTGHLGLGSGLALVIATLAQNLILDNDNSSLLVWTWSAFLVFSNLWSLEGTIMRSRLLLSTVVLLFSCELMSSPKENPMLFGDAFMVDQEDGESVTPDKKAKRLRNQKYSDSVKSRKEIPKTWAASESHTKRCSRRDCLFSLHFGFQCITK